MNFITKTLGSLTGSSFPYTFKEKVVYDTISDPSNTSVSIWNIYDGLSNKDNSLVSIFEFNLKDPLNYKYIQFAKNSFKKLRLLTLLPGVLNVIDSFENENYLYIITERIKPFNNVNFTNNDLKLLGIYQISMALKFVNIEGNSIHCNFNKNSIFINLAGDWKIASFELLCNFKEKDYEILNMATQLPSFKSTINPPEFIKNGENFNYIKTLNGNHATKFDSFKLGVFIHHLYNSNSNDLTNMNNIPKSMIIHLKKLLNQSITIRYSIEDFLSSNNSSTFNTPLIKLMNDLEQFNLMNTDEKMDVFKNLNDLLDSLPDGFFIFKILPQLIKLFNSLTTNENNYQSILLFILLNNLELYDDSLFNSLIKPIILKSISLPDRAIRITLINKLQQIILKLSNYEIQDKIFPNLIQGFNDTNKLIRQETLNSINFIVSNISDRQLNNDLLRYLAKLQNDESNEIRCLTVLTLTNISKLLNNNTRIGVLITAFGKSLKDSYIQTRLNSIIGFEKSIDYFTPDICCSRVLSTLAPALLDKSSKIRSKAEEVFEMYMLKIKTAANDLPKDVENENENEHEQDVVKETSLISNLNSFSFGFNSNKNSIFGFGNSNNNVNDSSNSLTMKNTNEPILTKPQQQQQQQQKQNTSNSSFLNDFEDDDELDLSDDDGWGFNDDADEMNDNVQNKPNINKNISVNKLSSSSNNLKTTNGNKNTSFLNANTGISSNSSNVSKAKSSLKLKPKNKLKLDLEIKVDDDENGWGDGW